MHFFCKLLLLVIVFFPALSLSFGKKHGEEQIYMRANKVEYDSKNEVIAAAGNIFIKFENYLINADYIYYDIKKDHLFAEGNIRIKDNEGKIITGERAVFKDRLKSGILSNFTMKIDNSVIVALIAKRIDENRTSLYKATFTPCQITCGKEPIWKISAKNTEVDFAKHKITYNNIFFQVYGVTIGYFPYFSHPTPDAPAQSGILVPEIKQQAFLIPLYLRAKDNLDFTLSPRLGKKYTIYELETRHLLKHGGYRILSSFGDPPFRSSADGKVIKNRRIDRYHVFANGQFRTRGLNYGFSLKRTSDKAYLKNYHEIFDSYLTSKIYVNSIDKRDYYSVEGYHFQGLRTEDENKRMPLVLPSVNYKKVMPINDDDSSGIVIKNNSVVYNETYIRQIARNSLDVSAYKDLKFDNGHIIEFSTANRADFYFVNNEDEQGLAKERIFYRNIPEVSSKWRYPLLTMISSKTSMKIEPIVSSTIGRPFENRFKKFDLIDVSKYDIDQESIYMNNRFSGKDSHEYGNRLNYGLNSTLYSEQFLLDSFIGQAIHSKNSVQQNNAEYVGSINLELLNQVFSSYRFRKDKELRPIRDEIELGLANEKIRFSSKIITLSNISKYFVADNFIVKKNRIKQLNLDVGYQVTPYLLIGGGSLYDLSNYQKPDPLTKSIRVTYLKDCVSITAKISDDFTHDTRRGVHKIRSKSVSIGLKVINM